MNLISYGKYKKRVVTTLFLYALLISCDFKSPEEWEMPEIYPVWEDDVYYEVWYGGVQEPSVHWDDTENIYKMWYEGTTVDTVLDMQNGEFFEHLGKVHQIGYAESLDGITWIKHPDNPIFMPKIRDGS